jgi:hypothetical protein
VAFSTDHLLGRGALWEGYSTPVPMQQVGSVTSSSLAQRTIFSSDSVGSRVAAPSQGGAGGGRRPLRC